MGILKAKSVCCPETKDHKSDKVICFINPDGIFIYCKHHKWIKLEFSKFGKAINFDGVAIKTTTMNPNIHFDATAYPVFSTGAEVG